MAVASCKTLSIPAFNYRPDSEEEAGAAEGEGQLEGLTRLDRKSNGRQRDNESRRGTRRRRRKRKKLDEEQKKTQITHMQTINETRERVKATVKSLWCCMLGGRKNTAEFLTVQGETEAERGESGHLTHHNSPLEENSA